jgi:hypothetical protein
MSAKLSGTDPRVVSFFNNVNGNKTDKNGRLVGSAKSTTGYLYVTANNSVQIVLPNSLLDYANAASGTMSGQRPVGIRAGGFNTAESAADEVSRIFASPESLAKFINSSECDAPAYNPDLTRDKKSVVSMIDFRPVKDAFYDAGYSFSIIESLRKAFGKSTVAHDWSVLTVTEFELRYGLV